MHKRFTWALLLLLIAVASIFFYLLYRPEPEPEATPSAVATRFIFTSDDGTLMSMRIYDKQYHIVELERPAGGLWSFTLPFPAPADQALAEAGATQIGSLLIVATLYQAQPLASMGLDFPNHVIKVVFAGSGEHILEIGNMTPTGSGYYLLVDNQVIHIVSMDGIESVLNLLSSPPYLPATSTPLPLTDIGSTPTP